MNKSDVITYEKIMLTLRLAPEVYQNIREKVYLEKEKKRGYSINEYISELVEKDLKKK
jgi:hypothetical protein